MDFFGVIILRKYYRSVHYIIAGVAILTYQISSFLHQLPGCQFWCGWNCDHPVKVRCIFYAKVVTRQVNRHCQAFLYVSQDDRNHFNKKKLFSIRCLDCTWAVNTLQIVQNEFNDNSIMHIIYGFLRIPTKQNAKWTPRRWAIQYLTLLQAIVTPWQVFDSLFLSTLLIFSTGSKETCKPNREFPNLTRWPKFYDTGLHYNFVATILLEWMISFAQHVIATIYVSTLLSHYEQSWHVYLLL